MKKGLLIVAMGLLSLNAVSHSAEPKSPHQMELETAVQNVKSKVTTAIYQFGLGNELQRLNGDLGIFLRNFSSFEPLVWLESQAELNKLQTPLTIQDLHDSAKSVENFNRLTPFAGICLGLALSSCSKNLWPPALAISFFTALAIAIDESSEYLVGLDYHYLSLEKNISTADLWGRARPTCALVKNSGSGELYPTHATLLHRKFNQGHLVGRWGTEPQNGPIGFATMMDPVVLMGQCAASLRRRYSIDQIYPSELSIYMQDDYAGVLEGRPIHFYQEVVDQDGKPTGKAVRLNDLQKKSLHTSDF